MYKSFELYPVCNLSSPVCSWDSMIRITDVNVKLILDVKKYQFLESMIIGIGDVFQWFECVIVKLTINS